MAAPWTAERREKFYRTIAAKRAGKAAMNNVDQATEGEMPLSAIPKGRRPHKGKRPASKPAKGRYGRRRGRRVAKGTRQPAKAPSARLADPAMPVLRFSMGGRALSLPANKARQLYEVLKLVFGP